MRHEATIVVRGSTFDVWVRRSRFVVRRTANDEPEPSTTNVDPRTVGG